MSAQTTKSKFLSLKDEAVLAGKIGLVGIALGTMAVGSGCRNLTPMQRGELLRDVVNAGYHNASGHGGGDVGEALVEKRLIIREWEDLDGDGHADRNEFGKEIYGTADLSGQDGISVSISGSKKSTHFKIKYGDGGERNHNSKNSACSIPNNMIRNGETHRIEANDGSFNFSRDIYFEK